MSRTTFTPANAARLLLGGLLLLLLSSPAVVSAQTWSACNPMSVTTCKDNEALGTTAAFAFNTSVDARIWNTTAGRIDYGAAGAAFSVARRGDSPTLQSNFYFFFGVAEVHMRAAAGQGIVSSIVLESDDLDEVDWEVMGGNTTSVETNYFGKGNTTDFDRAVYYPVDSPQGGYHNYTVAWTAEKLEWYIDTTLVRTLMYADANGGYNYPQTPMNLRIGIWAGGDPDNSNGTIEWAGGPTDYSKGPYTMYVQSAKVQDYSTGSAYHWDNKSGSFSSIKTISGNSTIADELNNPSKTSSSSSSSSTASSTPSSSSSSSPSLEDQFNGLSNTTKLAVYCSAGGAAALLLGMLTWCCCRKRKAGRHEREVAEAQQENERRELEMYQIMMKSGAYGHGSMEG